ncbi:MAG TPA: hypothetical protein VIM28_02165 [Solirubrobacterales bacterium]
MRPWWLKLAAPVLAVTVFATPSAAVANPTDVGFKDGSLTGFVADAPFSQGSFQNLSYVYDGCGTEPAEATCTWELRMSLFSDPARRCVSSTPESQLLWDSGERSGNGSVESGPLSFALEGCRGQILSIYYEAKKTFNSEEEEGPWKTLSSGSAGTLLSIAIGAESIEKIEQRIREANPASHPALPAGIPTLAVSANCRSLKIGSTRYSFAFRQMGCRKATNLAAMAHVSGGPPSGYACKALQGEGERCWRRGHPEKYVEWRPQR